MHRAWLLNQRCDCWPEFSTFMAPTFIPACDCPHIHSCMRLPPHSFLHASAPTFIPACVCPHIHSCMRLPPHSFLHVFAPTFIPACACPHIHSCMRLPPHSFLHALAPTSRSFLHGCEDHHMCRFLPWHGKADAAAVFATSCRFISLH